ncbi:MAG: hypothetical protein K6C68_09260 [Ruminococcus sp.]|nr:hypothetical protein [Ruminococcus sp.]
MKRVTAQCDRYGKVIVPELERSELGEIKSAVISYMKRRDFVSAASSSRIHDFVSDSINQDYCRAWYSDGEYEWSAHDFSYVEKYDMKLDDDFIAKIINTTA